MAKLTVTVDVTKIPRDRIVDREYTDKEGVKRIAKEVKFDVVPTLEQKVIATGDTWELKKTHFVVISPTKEERQAKTKTPFLGDAVQFVDKAPAEAPIEYPEQDITPEDIPF